jgi:UDP-N-acetylmuramoyl-tripeptide--D-alanyl-D-alanine ligase
LIGRLIRTLDAWRLDPARAVDFFGDWVSMPLASRRRRRNSRTTFIGVTGSGGKTTTKNLIHAVLARRLSGTASADTRNRAGEVGRVLFATRPAHDYCVQELGAFGPGTLDALLAAFRPQIGVVTSVAREHYAAFRSVEAVAEEKGKLVRALPASGTAILNADDPRVRAMAELSRARVVLVGRDVDAQLRAEEVTSGWPEGLSMVVRHGSARQPVHTNLLGTHWTTAVLAALATGLEMGVPLEEGAEALSEVTAMPGRLSRVEVGDGVTFVVDDWKAATWTVAAALEVLSSAGTARRWLVLGQLSDDPRKPSRLYRDVTRQALEVADRVVLTGRWAKYGLTAGREVDHGRVLAFETVRELHSYLERELRPGDLVLIKASGAVDHLERLVLARTDTILCWREQCGRAYDCSRCRLRNRPFAP